MVNLKGMTLRELEEFSLSIGEKKFRGRQLFEWIYEKDAASFAGMSPMSKSLREKLTQAAAIESLTLAGSQRSEADGTEKYLFELGDRNRIESVLIPPGTAFRRAGAEGEEEQKRLTLCVSTQAGCPLDCAFCATGTMGLLRNLSAGEIVDQLMQAKRISGRRITNIVYMGMGEPLMNYEAVMKSAEIIIAGMGIASRRITVSTAGYSPMIRRMADEGRKVKLAVSLHSLDDGFRSAVMPINRKFPLAGLLEAVQYYFRKMKRRVTFEYILFKDQNDRPVDADRLAALSRRIPSKVNIIPFHDIAFAHPSGPGAGLRPSPPERMEEFVRRLRAAHVTVFVRSSAGEEIDAACGQLAVKARGRRIASRSPSRAEGGRPGHLGSTAA